MTSLISSTHQHTFKGRPQTGHQLVLSAYDDDAGIDCDADGPRGWGTGMDRSGPVVQASRQKISTFPP